MGRAPCCDKANVKRGPWSPEEDAKLKEYIHNYGTGGNWIALPQKAGLKRCGKSCRLRWLNYLRPNIKHGEFSDEEDTIICTLFATIGSRWSIIAAQLPGRTDNDIKNYWNTKLKKKLMNMSNNINPNPQLTLSHHSPLILHNSPSPDPFLPSSPFNSAPNYYNTPPSATLSLTEFDQAAPNGFSFFPPSMQNYYHDHHYYQNQDQAQQFHGNPPNSNSAAALMEYGLEEIKNTEERVIITTMDDLIYVDSR